MSQSEFTGLKKSGKVDRFNLYPAGWPREVTFSGLPQIPDMHD